MMRVTAPCGRLLYEGMFLVPGDSEQRGEYGKPQDRYDYTAVLERRR